jgi:transcriptional regulator with XRE-family HTH domain
MLTDLNILKTARKSKCLTQKQVADRAGIRLRQYHRFESKERNLISASFRIAMAVCEALEIEPQTLLRQTQFSNSKNNLTFTDSGV